MAARTRLPLLYHLKLVHTECAVKEPAYPPIVPSLTAKSKSARLRQIEEHVKKIRASPVEEKLALITRIQRMKFVVYPQTFARDADRWYQHFTKTAYISGLPEKFALGQEKTAEEESSPAAAAAARSTSPEIDDDAFGDIRSVVIRAILHDHWYTKKPRTFLYRRQEQVVGPSMRNLVTGLTFSLAKYNPLLLHSSLDLNPQVNFYWRRGQRVIPKGHRKRHLEPIRFQIDDNPHSQIRITQQLPQFTSLEASFAAEVPEVTLAPNLMPLFRRQYDNHIFTGSKLPDPACYGHTQFHLVPDRYHRDRMARLQQSDQVEVFLRANALTSLFAWTGAQAMYQGHGTYCEFQSEAIQETSSVQKSPGWETKGLQLSTEVQLPRIETHSFWNHEDVTRPFVSQAVITDGQFFSFFCYQLNTVALSVETDTNNPRKNLLWGTESLRLYERVEDGAVVGLNDDVIKLLVQFLLNQP